MQRIKNILIGILVLLLLSWVGLYVAVRVLLPPEKVQALVEEHGTEALGRSLKVGGASVGVFPLLRVSVNDVEVGNGAGFSDEPLMFLGEIHFALDFKSLLALSPVVKEIRFVDLKLSYEVDEQGKTNVEELGGPKDSTITKPVVSVDSSSSLSLDSLGLPGTLELKRFAIENASVRYIDKKSGVDLILGQIDQWVNLQIDSDLKDIQTQGNLSIRSIEVKEQASGIQKGNVNVSISHDLQVNVKEQLLNIHEIQVGFQQETMSLRGSISNFLSEELGMDLKLTSSPMSVESLVREVPESIAPEVIDIIGTGSVQLDLSVLGVVGSNVLENPPKVHGTVQLKDIGFQYKRNDIVLSELNGNIVVTDDFFAIEKFGLKVSESDVGLDLQFSNYMSLLVPTEYKEKKNKSKWKPKLDVTVRSNNLNLDELLGALPESTEEVKEDTVAPITAYPRLPDILTNVHIQLGRTQLLSLEMTEYVQKLKVENHTIQTNLRGKLYTGGFSSDLTVDLRDSVDAKIAMKLDVNQVEANDFVSQLNDLLISKKGVAKTFADTDDQLYGKLSMDVDVKTNGLPEEMLNNAFGKIYAVVYDGKLVDVRLVKKVSEGIEKISKIPASKELTFSKWDMTLEVQDGKLIIKHMDLNKTPMGDFSVLGHIGFDDTMRLTIVETLPLNWSNKIKSTSRVPLYPVNNQGRVIAYHNVHGSFQDIQYELDLKRMAKEAALGKAAQERIDKAKKRIEQETQKITNEVKSKATKAKKETSDKAKKEVKKKSKEVLKKFGF